MSRLEQKKTGKGMPLPLQFIIGTLILAACSALLVYVMKEKGYYASGCDIWGHLFKSDLMYQNLKEGTSYPLYTNLWYNGIQPYRYWAPLPYYILAALQFVAGGDVLDSYYLFAGFSLFVGGMGWLLFGYSVKRIPFCTFFGIMWFFLPENIRVFFCEGNVPRMVTAILIPYLTYFIWRFIKREKTLSMVGIIVFMAMMSLSHVMISAMMGIGTFIFLVFYGLAQKKIVRSIEVITGMLISFALTGIWLLPALSGGLVGMDTEASASVMASLSYRLLDTLNPFNRLTGIIDTFYYGISIVIISVTGIVLAQKKERAGFYTALVILLLTTTAAVPFLSKLPLSQLLWMMRFATIAYAFFGWSLIEWGNARRYFSILLAVILVIDCIPSFMLQRYYTQMAGRTDDELALAKEITKQRVAILDLSAYGSYPSWELCEGENKTQYTFGWAWQGASTAPNIVLLNTALEDENYGFVFDRCLELGNDTVMIRKNLVGLQDKTEQDLLDGAQNAGYSLYKESNDMYIFHQDTPECFGVSTDYQGLAIGKYANQLSLAYPVFQTGASVYLDEYSIEELSAYSLVYLSGFQFHNRGTAEKLVADLSQTGTRVVIDMAHIPVDRKTNRMHFLGVTAQEVSFEQFFPTLSYKDIKVEAGNFQEDYTIWNTAYIDGAPKVIGTCTYSDKELVFAGTSENENVIYLGFNLLYHAIETEDNNVYQILNDIFASKTGMLPERRIVPMQVSYAKDGMRIECEEENVNTAIAYQDIFESADDIMNENHLLKVTKKDTKIQFAYPYKKAGSVVSIAGLLMSAIYIGVLVYSSKKSKKA